MNNILKDLLLIQSLDLGFLIEKYRLFFIGLLPSVFVLAIIIEYLDRLEPFTLVKRALISVLILTSITSFYTQSIDASMSAADEVMQNQVSGNILMMDMFSGVKKWDQVRYDRSKHNFYKDKNVLTGTLSFLKYHLFEAFVNDGFTVTIYFITKLCFLILKVVYSLVYYLGYGLLGIPCLIYLFPSMGNVLRGAVLSYLWCLIIPHILVFIISMIGSEINRGYVSGQIIGGSMMGTALLFILALFVAFTPLIGSMILNGSGISQAGGIIASIGANYVMNLPKNTVNNGAMLLTGASLGPKMSLAKGGANQGYKLAKGAKNIFSKSVPTSESGKSETYSQMKMRPPNHLSGPSSASYNSSSRDYAAKNTFKADFKDAPQKMSTSNSNQNFNKPNTNSNRSINNGRISKHGEINKRTQKSTYNNRPNKRTHASSHTRFRNIYKPNQSRGNERV
ncbi:MAG: hypothetical protein K9K67_15630 [Bacteriovoracaceae bacterium]|nr:hypothetical protein [Bacteriovoracaceae bacterium]